MNGATTNTKRRVAPLVACLLAAALGAFLAFGLASCGPKQVEVPDLAFMESAEAGQALEQAGLKLGAVTERADEDILLGDVVLEQSKEAGSKVDEGSAVDVVVSKGPKTGDPVTVPDLAGMTVEEAKEALFEVLLVPVPGDPETSDTVEPGKVCAQSAKAGSELTVLDSVTYHVSLGKEKVAVPDVAGKTLAEARKALEDAGLGCDTTTSYSDTVAKDSVIGQSVKAKEQVDKGTVVVLDVSLGKKPAEQVEVPNLIAYNLAAAKATLESAGLKYTYTGDEAGTVSMMNPAPGTKVDQGSTVTFELKVAAKSSSESDSKSDSKSSSAKSDESDGQNPVMEVIGTYAAGRATLTVEASGSSDASITVEWGSSATEGSTWTMKGKFDGKTVKYTNGKRVDYAYDDNGKRSESTVYTKGTGSFTFSGGKVTWNDEEENIADGMTFEFSS